MAIATAAVGATGGIAKFIEGQQMQKEAQDLINQFEWQDLTNPYEDQQISTRSAELQTNQANINTATMTDALQAGGQRALVGGLGRMQAGNNVLNAQIGADLDKQQKQLDYAKSGQDVRNQMMIEQRQANELDGYGQMLSMGQQTKWQGITDLMNTSGFVGQTDFGKKMDNLIIEE